jgi:hypothetical protein
MRKKTEILRHGRKRETMTCICGEELSLDVMGKNFKKHITENQIHLKYLRKLWRIKQKQKSQPSRWGEKSGEVTTVECVVNDKSI